jgi:hypothetical protein
MSVTSDWRQQTEAAATRAPEGIADAASAVQQFIGPYILPILHLNRLMPQT